jgi:hypothetical protein
MRGLPSISYLSQHSQHRSLHKYRLTITLYNSPAISHSKYNGPNAIPPSMSRSSGSGLNNDNNAFFELYTILLITSLQKVCLRESGKSTQILTNRSSLEICSRPDWHHITTHITSHHTSTAPRVPLLTTTRKSSTPDSAQSAATNDSP